MEFITLKNTRLASLLQNLIDGFFENPDVQVALKRVGKYKDTLIPDVYPCSDEYLNRALTQDVKEYGYPRSAYGSGMGKTNMDFNWQKFISTQDKISKIGLFLGTPVNALTMLYPDQGYIGWHHNGNAPGYNILITYSQDGQGRFKYYNKETQKIVVHEDPKGWSVKVGYYPDQRREKDRVYWHCAETTKARMSLAWVINHKEMWKNMIYEITGGDFNPSIFRQHQMNV